MSTPERRAVVSAVALALFLARGGARCAQPETHAVVHPHHDYALAGLGNGNDRRVLLERIRTGLLDTLRASGLAPAGYPRPCQVVSRPDPSHPGGSLQSCVERPPRPGATEGILLAPGDRYFLALSLVDFPDSRAYLSVVYLVPDLDDRRLYTDERFTLPRVALPFPGIPAAWHPRFWSVLKRGIEASGARAIDPGRP